MRIIDEQQLQAVIDSLVSLQRELLPRGADLLALMAEIEGQPATERGYAGVVRCMGEPAALGVRQTLEALVYAFAVLRVYLMQASHGPGAAEQTPQKQVTAMLAAVDVAAREAMAEFEKLLSAGALTPEQVSQIRAEVESLSAPAAAAQPASAAHADPMKALAEADRLERELLAEIEKLCAAAGVDPAQIRPELEKLKQPGPDQPPANAPKEPGARGDVAPKRSVPSEQGVLAELERAEQTARSNLPELERQLVDAGVDRAAIDELMALLKAPG